MKFNIKAVLAALLIAAVTWVASTPDSVKAQSVVQLPVYIDNLSVYDFGNGPQEFRTVQGNAGLFTMQGSGVGSTSGSSTALTLTGTPTTPPCVGCVISGTGITAGTTVISFNGTTTVGLSAAMTVAGGTAVAWGAACPSTTTGQRMMLMQAGVGADLPIYTYARICGAAPNAPGATVLPFPIGAH